MSLQTIIAMFVTCMAPLFLVYFFVDGIYVLKLDKITYVSEEPESDAPAQFKSFIVLCVAFAVAWALLSIYFAMFGGRKRAEEHARRKTMAGDMRQRYDGGMEWPVINLLKTKICVRRKRTDSTSPTLTIMSAISVLRAKVARTTLGCSLRKAQVVWDDSY